MRSLLHRPYALSRDAFLLSAVLSFLTISLAASPGLAQEDSESAKETVYAVRLVGEIADDEQARAEFDRRLAEGSFQRWIVRRDPSIRLTVGPEAAGDVVLHVSTLSVPQDLRNRFHGTPANFGDGSFGLGETTYDDPRLVFALRAPFRSADAPRPMLVFGSDAARTAELVDRLLVVTARRNWWPETADYDYLVWEHRHLQRSGKWTVEDQTIRLDPEERDDFAARAGAYAALTETRGDEVVVYAQGRRDNLAEIFDGVAGVAAAKLGVSLRPKPEIVFESDYAAQGRHLGEIGAAVVGEVDGVLRLHVVEHGDDLQLYRHGLARLILRRAEIDPPPLIAAGAALWITRSWYGRTWQEWTPELARAEVLPDAEELLADELAGSASEVLWTPIAAAVIDRMPGSTLLEKIRAVQEDRARVAAVLRELQTLGDQDLASPETDAGDRAELDFLHGMSFAMANGLDIGYHAPGVEPQLDLLRELGTDAVSLMPFAYQRDPEIPELSFLNRSPSSETDIGVIHSARRAQERGMTVLWKPHIWVSHESWPGDIEMTNEDDWQAWWRHYRRFTMHHAVLAAWTKAEVFSLGVELGRTNQRSEWIDLIASVRRVYDGALTYSGNWWGDFADVPFWDRLDYIGVDAYFPLAHEVEVDRETLVAGAREAKEQIATVAEKWERPVLLTEVGFSARVGAWVSPADEGGEVSEEHQRLAYEVLLEELGRPDWLRGLFVWKAFSHADAENSERPDFRFLGRPAEQVVRRYFTGEGGKSGDDVEEGVATAQ